MSSLGSSATTRGAVRRSLAATRPDVWGIVFQGLLLLSLLASLGILALLVEDLVQRSLPVWTTRGLGVLTSSLSSDPTKAGLAQGLVGTAVLGTLVALIAFPIGVMTAVYLEEYAHDDKITRFITLNIRNLAGVPSVVYGLLGLSVFVAVMDLLDGDKLTGRNILAGGITLAVLVLPIVIITSVEALRAVPATIREAGYGVGASRWEVTRKLVLPAAAPGILTGTVLSLSRALGETAPLIVAGAVIGSFSGLSLANLFTGSYTAIPMIAFDWARRPQDEFRALAAAASIVLLAVTLVANGIAILLRNRYERTW